MEELEDLGVRFVSLKDNIDLDSAVGRLMVQVIAAFAEFERNLIRERVVSGLENAKAKGTKLGRPQLHDPDEIRRLRSEGKTYSQIEAIIGAPAPVIRRAIKEECS